MPTWKEPSLDEGVCPLHGVCSSSARIEGASKAGIRSRVDTTTNEVIHHTVVGGLAVRGRNATSLGSTVDGTGCITTVKGCLVRGELVDTFNDIDFATVLG